MSGDLLRTSTYANPNTSYFALAGAVQQFSSTINTGSITASTISLYQTGGFGTTPAVYVSSTGTAQMRIAGGNPGFAEFVMSGQFANMAVEGAPQCSIAITQPAVQGRVAGMGMTGAGFDVSRFYCWNNNQDCYYELASYTTPFAPTGKSEWKQYASGQSNILGLYDPANTLKASVEMNQEGTKVDSYPVARPSKVAYVGLVGTVITVPASTTQTISNNFSVKAGHTYRVSVQCRLVNADATATTFSELLLTTGDASIAQVGLGSTLTSQSANVGEQAFIAVCVATADSANAHIVCVNSSATDATDVTLNAVDVANAPSILVEDLGVI